MDTVPAFAEWEANIIPSIRHDPLWSFYVYRYALFLVDRARVDAAVAGADPSFALVGPQLMRSVGSIASNIAEGYSYRSVRDRARFYEYALGSARKARTWYYQLRAVVESRDFDVQFAMLERVIRILTTLVRRARQREGRAPH